MQKFEKKRFKKKNCVNFSFEHIIERKPCPSANVRHVTKSGSEGTPKMEGKYPPKVKYYEKLPRSTINLSETVLC